MARRRSVGGMWTAVPASLCCLLAGPAATSRAATDLLPDMVADAPTSPSLQTYVYP